MDNTEYGRAIEDHKLALYKFILGLGCAADSIAITSVSYVMSEMDNIDAHASGKYVIAAGKKSE